MTDYEKFLCGCYYAVVKIKKYTDDLYRFLVLMENLGFGNYVKSFEKNCCDVRSREEKEKREYIREEDFCDDYFYHLAKINNIDGFICIEFQWGKGFTFGSFEDYYNKDEVKMLSVDDLIKATNKEELFNMNYEETNFLKEIKNREDDLAVYLTDFCEWYEWQLVKFPQNKYNILDIQTDEFVGYFGNLPEENGTLRDCIERVFYRMVDFYVDEEEHEEIRDVEKRISKFVELGDKYNLYGEKDKEWLQKWLEEEREYLKEEE